MALGETRKVLGKQQEEIWMDKREIEMWVLIGMDQELHESDMDLRCN